MIDPQGLSKCVNALQVNGLAHPPLADALRTDLRVAVRALDGARFGSTDRHVTSQVIPTRHQSPLDMGRKVAATPIAPYEPKAPKNSVGQRLKPQALGACGGAVTQDVAFVLGRCVGSHLVYRRRSFCG
jgi:hypothetical protein